MTSFRLLLLGPPRLYSWLAAEKPEPEPEDDRSVLSLVSLLKLRGAKSGRTWCLRLAEGLSVKLFLVIRGLDLRSVELPMPSWGAGADI